jgi:tRNA(Leu) C34 or U34 (ribose-2'-O)-methylase TrmL
MRDLGCNDLNMIPLSGIKAQESQIKLTEWESYLAFFDAHPDLKRVFVEPRSNQTPNSVWLHEDYKHPEECVYVFGSNHYNPTIAHKRNDDDIVSIKTEKDGGVLWANQAMCIILYDRYIRNGSNNN